jgi:hypothetical protein
MGASRSGQWQFVYQRRLAPTADAGRWPHHAMRHFRLSLLVVLGAVVISLPATASMMVGTHNWSVAGPGGHYGLIEEEYIALTGEHVGWDTLVLCGPCHVTLPCRMWATITIGVVFCCLAVAVVFKGCRYVKRCALANKHLQPTPR